MNFGQKGQLSIVVPVLTSLLYFMSSHTLVANNTESHIDYLIIFSHSYAGVNGDSDLRPKVIKKYFVTFEEFAN